MSTDRSEIPDRNEIPDLYQPKRAKHGELGHPEHPHRAVPTETARPGSPMPGFPLTRCPGVRDLPALSDVEYAEIQRKLLRLPAVREVQMRTGVLVFTYVSEP